MAIAPTYALALVMRASVSAPALCRAKLSKERITLFLDMLLEAALWNAAMAIRADLHPRIARPALVPVSTVHSSPQDEWHNAAVSQYGPVPIDRIAHIPC